MGTSGLLFWQDKGVGGGGGGGVGDGRFSRTASKYWDCVCVCVCVNNTLLQNEELSGKLSATVEMNKNKKKRQNKRRFLST